MRLFASFALAGGLAFAQQAASHSDVGIFVSSLWEDADVTVEELTADELSQVRAAHRKQAEANAAYEILEARIKASHNVLENRDDCAKPYTFVSIEGKYLIVRRTPRNCIALPSSPAPAPAKARAAVKKAAAR